MSFSSVSYGGKSSKSYSKSSYSSDLFAQTESISHYIKSHFDSKRNDPAFALLQEFFGIFHDQMRINFDLRNELALIKRNPKFDLEELEKRKTNVETFIKYFNKVKNFEHKDLQDVKLTIEENIDLMNKSKTLSEQVQENTKTKELLENSLKDLENSIQNHDNEFKKSMKALNDTIAVCSSKSIKLQNAISDLEPCINSLEIRVQDKESKKQELQDILNAKKQELIEIKNIHDSSHEKRSSIKLKLRTKVGKLTATYQQLIDDEQPLIKALEEAEAQLEQIKIESNEKIDQYNKESEELLRKLQEIETSYSSISATYESNKSSLNDLTRGIKLNRHIHMNSLNDHKQLRAKIDKIEENSRKLLQNSKSIEDELQIIRESRTNVNNQINLRTQQIEQLRQENNRISSLIRVAESNKQNELSTNDIIKQKESIVRQSLSSSQEEYEIYSEKIDLVRKTLAAFSTLQDSMMLSGIMGPLGVASRAIEFIRVARQKIEDDEPPTRVTTRMVNEEIGNIAYSISMIDEKLNH